MFPVADDVSANGCPILYVNVFYKCVFTDIDRILRTGQGTAQIVFLYLRSVQFIFTRIIYILIHVRQFQIIRIVNRAGSLFHTPFVTDIGTPVFVICAVAAGTEIKTDTGTALPVSGHRTGLVHHLVAAVGDQNAVTPETVRVNARSRRNDHRVLHTVHPDTGGARTVR